MGKKVEWDFSLVITGTNPHDLPLARLAEYLTAWAALLGVQTRPMFSGVTRGCVSLRTRVDPMKKLVAAERLQNAANDDETQPVLHKIEQMLARDGLRRARVMNSTGKVLHMMLPWRETAEMIVQDTAEIDGRVFRISGKDQSTSVGLIEDGTGNAITVETNNDGLARRFAAQFKGGLLRVALHGTWTRNTEGRWEPKRLIADSFEEIEETPLVETMLALQSDPHNRWASIPPEQALAKWRRIRYGTKAEPA